MVYVLIWNKIAFSWCANLSRGMSVLAWITTETFSVIFCNNVKRVGAPTGRLPLMPFVMRMVFSPTDLKLWLCSKILTISASNNSKDVKCLVVGLKGLLPWRSIMLTSKKGEGREKKMPTTCKDTTSQGNWGTNCRLKTVCELHSHQGTKTTRVFDYHFNQEKRSSRSLTSNDNRRRSREKWGTEDEKILQQDRNLKK